MLLLSDVDFHNADDNCKIQNDGHNSHAIATTCTTNTDIIIIIIILLMQIPS